MNTSEFKALKPGDPIARVVCGSVGIFQGLCSCGCGSAEVRWLSNQAMLDVAEPSHIRRLEKREVKILFVNNSLTPKQVQKWQKDNKQKIEELIL